MTAYESRIWKTAPTSGSFKPQRENQIPPPPQQKKKIKGQRKAEGEH